MAATTVSIVTPRRDDGKCERYAIYQAIKALTGTLKNFNTSGYLVEGSDTASEIFAGVGAEEVDNSAGASGALTAKVYTDGIFDFTLQGGGAAVTDIGTRVFVKDNQTVAKAADATNDIPCGTIVAIRSATVVGVDISIGARKA